MSIELMEYKLKKAKAETAKFELEISIEKKKRDIENLKDHIKLQDKIINEADEKIVEHSKG